MATKHASRSHDDDVQTAYQIHTSRSSSTRGSSRRVVPPIRPSSTDGLEEDPMFWNDPNLYSVAFKDGPTSRSPSGARFPASSHPSFRPSREPADVSPRRFAAVPAALSQQSAVPAVPALHRAEYPRIHSERPWELPMTAPNLSASILPGVSAVRPVVLSTSLRGDQRGSDVLGRPESRPREGDRGQPAAIASAVRGTTRVMSGSDPSRARLVRLHVHGPQRHGKDTARAGARADPARRGSAVSSSRIARTSCTPIRGRHSLPSWRRCSPCRTSTTAAPSCEAAPFSVLLIEYLERGRKEISKALIRGPGHRPPGAPRRKTR
jgi:hypothetical protein